MPRHDRAYGRWQQPSKGGGSQRRKQRTPSNTYAAKQSRPSPVVTVPVTDDGRNDGNTNKGGGKPQGPKAPKGGSKGPRPPSK